jgi:hypothetical protein
MSMQWEHHTQGQVHICSASFNMLKRFYNGELEIRPFFLQVMAKHREVCNTLLSLVATSQGTFFNANKTYVT